MTTSWIIATAILAGLALLFIILLIHDRNWWRAEDRKMFADKYEREENEWYKSTRP